MRRISVDIKGRNDQEGPLWTFRRLKVRQLQRLETSGTDYTVTMHHIPEEGLLQLHTAAEA